MQSKLLQFRCMKNCSHSLLMTRQALAVAYSEARRWNEAAMQYEQILAEQTKTLGSLHPEKLAAQYSLANAYENVIGNYEEAVADYTRSLELDPENSVTLTNRGLALTNLVDPLKSQESRGSCDRHWMTPGRWATRHHGGLARRADGPQDAHMELAPIATNPDVFR